MQVKRYACTYLITMTRYVVFEKKYVALCCMSYRDLIYSVRLVWQLDEQRIRRCITEP
jgi:hypothetical protein